MKKRCTPIAAIAFVLLLGGCSGPDAPPVLQRPDDRSSDQENVVRGLRCTLTADKQVVRPKETVTLTFRLDNETDEPIHFVFARGKYDPWGSATPVVTDPNGRHVSFAWPILAYVGANRKVLSIIVVPSRGIWKASIPLRPSYETMKKRWVPGTYTVQVRFQVNSPDQWLGGTYGKGTRPLGLEALREVKDTSFWARELLSDPIKFTCSENHGPSGNQG